MPQYSKAFNGTPDLADAGPATALTARPLLQKFLTVVGLHKLGYRVTIITDNFCVAYNIVRSSLKWHSIGN